jgi:hypothetical protein
MRWLLLTAVLLAGCQGTVGPLQRRDQPAGPITYLPTDEQEARVRDRLPLAPAGPDLGPRTYFDNPLTREGR